ncbi:MAG: hypothetical protein J5I92_15300 [Thiogranum sp.]|nr:hypothetical protein [Thiogranum sp.]
MVDHPSEPLANLPDEEEAAALVSIFFKIAAVLQLSEPAMIGLLRLGTQSSLGDLKNVTPDALRTLTDDQLTRLAYIVVLYGDLEQLFSITNVTNWLNNSAVPQDGYTRPWGSEAPLAHMINAEDGFRDVYDYVKGMLNGQ